MMVRWASEEAVVDLLTCRADRKMSPTRLSWVQRLCMAHLESGTLGTAAIRVDGTNGRAARVGALSPPTSLPPGGLMLCQPVSRGSSWAK